jgi:hypothetical protein
MPNQRFLVIVLGYIDHSRFETHLSLNIYASVIWQILKIRYGAEVIVPKDAV